MKHIFLTIYFMFFCVFLQSQDKSVLAKFTDEDIEIDGVLNEASWSKVLPATNFHEYFPNRHSTS